MLKPGKSAVILVAMVVIIGILAYQARKKTPPANPPPTNAQNAPSTNHPYLHSNHPFAAESETAEDADQGGLPKIPRDKVEDYLRRHNRDAASLLTAFHVLKDTNYLNEAATNFPNDPHLQWTILARDAFPEDKRKWLDAFKTSSPSNSLANYLSAQDYFKNNQPDAAMKEITAASAKSQFADYSMEAILDAEELYRFNGNSAAETHAGAMATISDDLNQLAQFKNIARGLQDLQHQYANSGDAASVQTLAQTGIDFANRIATGNNGAFVIDQLVGNASQAIVLQALDQNTSYDFLGGETPAQRLADIQQQKASIRDLNKNFTAATTIATDDQMNGYWERSKIYGGLPAMRWLVEQTGATPNSGN